MYTRKQRRIISAWSVAVVLLAVVPNVFAVGHWPVQPAGEHVHAEQGTETHTEHCHGDTSQCDGPAFVAVGALADESTDIYGADQRQFQVAAAASAHCLDGWRWILTPPPRASSTLSV